MYQLLFHAQYCVLPVMVIGQSDHGRSQNTSPLNLIFSCFFLHHTTFTISLFPAIELLIIKLNLHLSVPDVVVLYYFNVCA